MFSSVDVPDDRKNCILVMSCGWRYLEMTWLCFSFSFWTFLAVWFTGCTGFPRSCLKRDGLLRHCLFVKIPDFRFGKVHIPWLLFCCDKFLHCCVPSTRDAASDFELIVILLSSFSEYPQTFGCNRTCCGWETCRNKWRQVHRCGFRFRHNFLLLFVPASSLPSCWRSLSSWSGWCWTNEKDCSIRHVWNYLWSKCLRVDVWCRCTWFESWCPD